MQSALPAELYPTGQLNFGRPLFNVGRIMPWGAASVKSVGEKFSQSQSGYTLIVSFLQGWRMSVGHYENFPVGSLLLPARIRPAVHAIYHFARSADDLADRRRRRAEARLAALDDIASACWRLPAAAMATAIRCLPAGRADGAPCAASAAVSGFAQRLQPGCQRHPLRQLCRFDRLLPALGQSGGAADAAFV